MRYLLLVMACPLMALAPAPSLIRTWPRVLSIPERIVLRSRGLEHLALATSYRESRFNPNALHLNRNGSIDRGPFQLNSRYYPPMSLDDNIDAGIAAVVRAKRCGSDVQARWAYVHGHCKGAR